MATGRFSVFTIIRLDLHVVAVVVAYLIILLSLFGIQSVDTWIVLCIAAYWSVFLNSYEAMRQGAIAAATCIGKDRPRLAGPCLGYIGGHIVTPVLLHTGILVFLIRRSTRDVLLGGPTTPEKDKLKEEEHKLSTMTLIAGQLACILQSLFSIVACVEYDRMRRQKLKEASLSAAGRLQPADNKLQV